MTFARPVYPLSLSYGAASSSLIDACQLRHSARRRSGAEKVNCYINEPVAFLDKDYRWYLSSLNLCIIKEITSFSQFSLVGL
jgi:hypothetical protein